MKGTSLSCFLMLILTSIQVRSLAQDTLAIAFGSCNKADLNQSYWSVIDSETTDTWVWLGDIVYADSRNPKKLKKSYNQLANNKYYKTFRKHNKVYGIWDDHDYGENDGGADYPIKDKSKNLLLDFLDVEKSNPAYHREGAYQSHVISNHGLSIKLILLDVRYFRDKLENNPDPKIRYLADDNAQILGEGQWNWLAEELNNADEDLIIIGSGSQVIPEEHGYEKWADYPTERNRFLALIKRFSEKKILLLSGDRHMAEVSAIAVDDNLFLYEITSSGLTHSWSNVGTEPNGFRIRDLHTVKNYGLIQLIKNKDELRVEAVIKSIDGNTLDRYEIFPQ